MSYIDIQYKGSYAYNTVFSIHDVRSLKYRLRYTEGAIMFHEKEGNKGQITFFKDEKKLILNRIKKLEKSFQSDINHK
ncbi:hypothetical protein [Paenibacillus sp. O199]|uniref:hypothetical protein n=1 Tax=Paenibacillus sp. O199 TaxID=1643925 RepID=UPI0007BFE588|nr:hypothetical protein [Paenibacillus sp. O199]